MLDLGEYVFSVSFNGDMNSSFIIFQSSGIRLNVVKSKKLKNIKNQKHIESTISNAIKDRILILPKYQSSWHVLDPPSIYTFPSIPSRIYIYYPFTLITKYGDDVDGHIQRDERGSSFLVISKDSKFNISVLAIRSCPHMWRISKEFNHNCFSL